MMERLKSMKEILMAAVQGQLGNLQQANTEELGEAIDMIKDLSEAIYYCTITKAMEEKEHEQPSQQMMYMPESSRRMYGGEPSSTSRTQSNGNMGGGSRNYYEREWPMRDIREGQSPVRRKMYMESKELTTDKNLHMNELESYAQELTSDIVDMVQEATPEEKKLLHTKLAALTERVKNMM